MTRTEKKKRLKSNEQWFFRTLAEWPLVLLTWLSLKYRQNGVSDSPLYKRKTSSKSTRCRLSSSVHKPNCARRVWRGSCFIPGAMRVFIAEEILDIAQHWQIRYIHGYDQSTVSVSGKFCDSIFVQFIVRVAASTRVLEYYSSSKLLE